MSFRWPLKSTRGFSATPRRGSKGSSGMLQRQTPKPSRSFARRVVKTAGPLEKCFFTSSTMTDPDLIPGTYANSAVRNSENTFNVFTPSDYGVMVGSRERIFIRKMNVQCYLQSVAGIGDLPWNVFGYACLLVGRQDDITDDVILLNGYPFGTIGNLVQFADVNPKVVKQRARKRFTMTLTGTQYTDPGTDVNTTSQVIMDRRPGRLMNFTLRNLWLTEPEQVTLFFKTQRYSLNSSPENPNTSGSVVGWHETYVQYSKY